MENNEESEASRGHIVNMVRDLINNDRPSFGNIFTHLAINLIERSMIREAENRSLEENNKPVIATEEQMESLGNYQIVTKINKLKDYYISFNIFIENNSIYLCFY